MSDQIDLQPFCSDDEDSRYYLRKPSSRGAFTYATDGKCLIEVPRRADVEEVPTYPHCEKVMEQFRVGEFLQLKPMAIPPNTVAKSKCSECDGLGSSYHNCPTCHCDCRECDGTGYVEIEHITRVRVGDGVFDGGYISKILVLPGVRFNVGCARKTVPGTSFEFDLLCFQFEGGRGILSGMKGSEAEVIMETLE